MSNGARYWMALLPTLLLWPILAGAFEDDEACLMCHKYPKMGRITDEGIQKSYYVVPNTFSRTVHRNVPCRDCHSYIKQLPHKPVEEGVRCDSECHSVQNPSTGQPFSHKPIYNAFKESVHSREKVEDDRSDADKPYCITCHTNPLYNESEETPPKHIVDRCVVCHEDEKFANKWYSHTSRRIREVKRSSQEIVALCSTCHGDEEMVTRHRKAAEKEGRELGKKFPIAVESYQDSFHGKVTKYGSTDAANCLDCHASAKNYYMSVHELRPSSDPESPVHKDNRVKTCKRCHETADANYAALDPHPSNNKEDNAFNHYAELLYNIVGNVALVGLVGMALFETVGRRRDGASWRFMNGTSWRRRRRF
ncbi:multiheme c-type cytochrome [Thiohalomonas denitrificans]|uniref:multiheme c-type cytochrome n=1 Tax=Thiohalomonas denitrificans TaxID=415747 RepID=UPI0026EA869E|nr:hypothetical protein [Thiohalomonas denitrificans]